MSAAYEVFLLLAPPNLCFRTALLGCALAEDNNFIMVELALLFRLRIIFIGTFFSSAKNTKLLVIITVYSRYVKMVLSKRNTSGIVLSVPHVFVRCAPCISKK